uniref:Uncharacterized protein n=1 Tax=Rhizophora mucronata TaxID=61149 RepID=A0A2P2QP93_RHIMU
MHPQQQNTIFLIPCTRISFFFF